MNQKFKINWRLVQIIVIPVWSLVFYCIWVITYPAIRSVILLAPFPDSWTWLTILLVDIGFIISGLFMSWGVVSGFLTEITATYIRRNLLIKKAEISLAEVTDMKIRNYRLELTAGKQKFALGLLFYKNPDEVVNFIRNNIKK